MKYESDIIQFIKETKELMKILYIIQDLHLPQGCLCAGTLRNAIWDNLSGRDFRTINDIDVVYFDPDSPYEDSLNIQESLMKYYPSYDWEVKNEVYMHTHNPDTDPYISVEDAISKFPETPTAIGARLIKGNEIELIAPHGLQDLMNFTVRPTPFTACSLSRLEVFHQRIKKKNWHEEWPQIAYIKPFNE